MTPNQKIAMAKRLLIEATQELRAARHAAADAEVCGCGHRRDEHTVSPSINYTGGFCMVPECRCHWFMQAGTGRADDKWFYI